MNRKRLLVLGFSLISLAVPAAMADDFIDDSADASFQADSDSFSSSLDNLSSRQRRESDYSNMQEAHRYLTNQQANQTDTWKVSQDAFNNTQQQMVLSGGAYNNQGFIWPGGFGGGMGGGGGGGWGGSAGGFGGGGQIIPDQFSSGQPPTFQTPNYGGRYYRRNVSTN
ncbi:MAG: hypothetical protein K2X77_05960 [Candidatus Obscuribacterales bacterium]|jgi:hypothetical protein|nr:hypothetical protein [Candidatus Obscuribacterales bacterium]